MIYIYYSPSQFLSQFLYPSHCIIFFSRFLYVSHISSQTANFHILIPIHMTNSSICMSCIDTKCYSKWWYQICYGNNEAQMKNLRTNVKYPIIVLYGMFYPYQWTGFILELILSYLCSNQRFIPAVISTNLLVL